MEIGSISLIITFSYFYTIPAEYGLSSFCRCLHDIAEKVYKF